MCGDIWKTLCLICHASAQWQQDRQQQYHKSFGECASCKTNSSRCFAEYVKFWGRVRNIKPSYWEIHILQEVWVEMLKLWGCAWGIQNLQHMWKLHIVPEIWMKMSKFWGCVLGI